ncbi:MAG: hypothetical protein MZU97_02855 [Bacillus subtilis]|nr:hypothetical protein [Bacillus subtilis]
MDVGGAVLDARDLARFKGREGVVGLGEMMNVPGVLGGRSCCRKETGTSFRSGTGMLRCFREMTLMPTSLPDSRAIMNAPGKTEAEEKLKKGMYLYIREGSTEHNIEETRPADNTAYRFPLLFCH